MKGSAQSCSAAGYLLQHYVMDHWLKIEEQHLQFIRDIRCNCALISTEALWITCKEDNSILMLRMIMLMSGLIGQLSCHPSTVTLWAKYNSIIRMLWQLLPNMENQTCSLPLPAILPGQKSPITFDPIKVGMIPHSCHESVSAVPTECCAGSLGKQYSWQISGSDKHHRVSKTGRTTCAFSSNVSARQ